MSPTLSWQVSENLILADSKWISKWIWYLGTFQNEWINEYEYISIERQFQDTSRLAGCGNLDSSIQNRVILCTWCLSRFTPFNTNCEGSSSFPRRIWQWSCHWITDVTDMNRLLWLYHYLLPSENLIIVLSDCCIIS